MWKQNFTVQPDQKEHFLKCLCTKHSVSAHRDQGKDTASNRISVK